MVQSPECLSCRKRANIRDLRQCSFCGARGQEPPYYCIRHCSDQNCTFEGHPTCWRAHLPEPENLRRLHEMIDPIPQLCVNAITYSEPDPEKQRLSHDEDRIAQWFIVRFDGEHARLRVSDRFQKLCNPGVLGNKWSSNQYPSFVSFIGNTGAGKSTLTRAMILMGQLEALGLYSLPRGPLEDDYVSVLLAARLHGPVTRTAHAAHLTDPTSSGVHLYKDVAPPGPQPSPKAKSGMTTMLFADCEGFRGDIAKTNSERDSDLPPALSGFRIPPQQRGPGFWDTDHNLLFDRPIVSSGYRGHGKEGAELLYARFLYAFSDVVVFVTKEDQQLHMDMQRLLEWAASGVNKSVNHLAQKTLIVVRNKADCHKPEFYDSGVLKDSLLGNLGPFWKGSQALVKFKKEYDKGRELRQQQIHSNSDFLAVFFQEVKFCYIPDKDKAPVVQIFQQYQKLRMQIARASQAGQMVRSKSWTRYNAPTLSHLLSRAFEHFRTSDEPFDFYRASRKDNPNPVSISDHIANLLRHIQLLENKITNMFSTVVSVCLVSWAFRNLKQGTSSLLVWLPTVPFNMTIALEPDDIFREDLRPHCEDGIDKYREKYQDCGYRFEGGSRCVTKRPGHEEHSDEKGSRISGKFNPSEYQEDSAQTVNEIRKLFIAVYKDLCSHDWAKPGLPDHSLLKRRREGVFKKFAEVWKLTRSNKTCFTCLQAIPDHLLPCGHGYCPDCVREFGRKSDSVEYGQIMDHCVLCRTEWSEQQQLVQLKPKCAGIRILTLDGGGVRGIIELALLELLEHRIGLNLPISNFFDLIMGTSTVGATSIMVRSVEVENVLAFPKLMVLLGGIIALGLAMTKSSLAEVKDKFTKLARETFMLRREGKITVLDPYQITSTTFMLLRIWDSIYRTTPLKEGLKRMFGENLNLYSSATVTQQQRSTKVAVTSTKNTAAIPCLITNYNRPALSEDEDFEREDEDKNDMKVWEAGLATSAAPFYFRPFYKTETHQDYVDGALHANLPISYALKEMENLWPSLNGRPFLDALVAIGTGVQKKELHIPKVLEIGGFKQVCINFHNNIDSEQLWRRFASDSTSSPEVRQRIHRINANIVGDYVAIDHYKKMEAIEDMVKRQMEEWDGKPSPLSQDIAKVADVLIASLFFFEPDAASLADAELRDPTLIGRYELRGSICCRLTRSSQELKRLVTLVHGFWRGEILAATSSLELNNLNPIQFTDNCKYAIRTTGERFKLDCAISTLNPAEANQVIAITLVPPREEEKYYSYSPVPISGFPISFNDLQERARST